MKLSDLTEPDSPVTYGVVKPGPEDPDGTLFIRGGDVSEGRILIEQLRTITPGVSQQYRRTQLRGGEIVVSLVGSPGQVAIVPKSLRGANIARQVALVRLRDNVDTRFVKYFLASPIGQDTLGAHSLGSVQQVINLRDLKTVQIPLPPLPEQRTIAHILGTLDDKIELNRRMNETLEEMARALFKSWFVDFDPVRAKMDGRWRHGESLPGLPAKHYDLFPGRLVDSELGEIPEGWEVKALEKLVELAYGKALRAVDRKDGSVPVYGSNGQVGWHDKKLVAGPGIVVGRKGNPGVVTWTHDDFFPIDTTFYVVPRDANGGLPFLLFALTDQDLPFVSADSVVPGLNRNLAYMNKQLMPDQHVLAEFDDYASAIFSRCHRLEEESRALAALRDALLPRLVSGQVGGGESELPTT